MLVTKNLSRNTPSRSLICGNLNYECRPQKCQSAAPDVSCLPSENLLKYALTCPILSQHSNLHTYYYMQLHIDFVSVDRTNAGVVFWNISYEPCHFVLLKDVNHAEGTSIKDSYKTTDVGDRINGHNDTGHSDTDPTCLLTLSVAKYGAEPSSNAPIPSVRDSWPFACVP